MCACRLPSPNPFDEPKKASNITAIERERCHQAKRNVLAFDSATTSSPFFMLVGVAAIMMKLGDT